MKNPLILYLIIVKLEVISRKEVIRLFVDIITCFAFDPIAGKHRELWDLEVERNCDRPIILLIKYKCIS